MRSIGCSNFSAAQVEQADAVSAARGLARFVSAQNRVLLARAGGRGRARPGLRAARDRADPVLPARERPADRQVPPRRSPSRSGTRLSGRLDVSDERWDRIEALEAFAPERGVGLLERRDRRPRRAAGGLLGDRGGDEPRAGTRERRGRQSGSRRPPSSRSCARCDVDASGRRWRRAGSEGASCSGAATRPVSEWLVARLDPRPGQTILELAAGTGETGFLAAPLLGPDGRLISSDREPGMVEAAEAARRGERGIANVEFRVLDAERLELPDCERRRRAQPLRLHPQGRPAAGAAPRSAASCAPGGRLAFCGLGRARAKPLDDRSGRGDGRARPPPAPSERGDRSSRRNATRRRSRACSRRPASRPETSRSSSRLPLRRRRGALVLRQRAPRPGRARARGLPDEVERAEVRAEVERRARSAPDGFELGGVSLNVAAALGTMRLVLAPWPSG